MGRYSAGPERLDRGMVDRRDPRLGHLAPGDVEDEHLPELEGLAAAARGGLHERDRVLVVGQDRVDLLLERVGLLRDAGEAPEDRLLAFEVAGHGARTWGMPLGIVRHELIHRGHVTGCEGLEAL